MVKENNNINMETIAVIGGGLVCMICFFRGVPKRTSPTDRDRSSDELTHF